MRPGSGVAIARVREASDAEWDAAWLASDHATWFHSRAWSEIWAEVRRDELVPAARVVEFSDGVSALLPLSEERAGGMRRFRASPAGTYGGWLAEEELGKLHAERLFAYLIDEVPGLSWRICPWDALAAEMTAGLGEPETTRALRLDASFEEIERRWSNGPRWGARRARREGLEAGIATDLADWRAYFALYQASLARWGERASSRYDWKLFEAIRTHDPVNARLWVARLGSEIVAGALVFYAPGHAAWWHGSTAATHFAKRPMNLLLHEMIRDACAQDLAIFDLGPSHAHGGVEEFKSGYAADAFPCPMIRTRVPASRSRLRRALSKLVR